MGEGGKERGRGHGGASRPPSIQPSYVLGEKIEAQRNPGPHGQHRDGAAPVLTPVLLLVLVGSNGVGCSRNRFWNGLDKQSKVTRRALLPPPPCPQWGWRSSSRGFLRALQGPL